MANPHTTRKSPVTQVSDSQEFHVGQRVRIINNGDFFDGMTGTIIRVYATPRRYTYRDGHAYIVKLDNWTFSLDNELGFNAGELEAVE